MASGKSIVQRMRVPGNRRQANKKPAPFRLRLSQRSAGRPRQVFSLRTGALLVAIGGMAGASILTVFFVQRLYTKIEREEIKTFAEPVGTLPDEEKALAELEAVVAAE